MDRPSDPYRTLGIQRGATEAQIKAAHRRLAKRWHPDTADGDTARFLEVQAAYSLLSDPVRRRDWDRAHSAEPVRASEPGTRRPRAGSARPRGTRGAERPASARPTGPDEAGTTGGARPRGARKPGAAKGRAPGDGAMGPDDPRHGHAGTWSASDREPGTRTGTWSASGVPWWEDFQPRDAGDGSHAGDPARSRTRARGGSRSGARPAPGTAAGGAGGAGAQGSPPGAGDGLDGDLNGPGAGATTGDRETGMGTGPAGGHRSPDEMDLYSRSSGAAWSMAARRHFRKGDSELARGGAFRYRGTQVVTAGEARRVAAEEAAEAEAEAEAEARRAREALLRRDPRTTAPRTAFDHADAAAREPAGATPRARTGGATADAATARPAAGPAPGRAAGATAARTSTTMDGRATGGPAAGPSDRPGTAGLGRTGAPDPARPSLISRLRGAFRPR